MWFLIITRLIYQRKLEINPVITWFEVDKFVDICWLDFFYACQIHTSTCIWCIFLEWLWKKKGEMNANPNAINTAKVRTTRFSRFFCGFWMNKVVVPNTVEYTLLYHFPPIMFHCFLTTTILHSFTRSLPYFRSIAVYIQFIFCAQHKTTNNNFSNT